MFGNGFSSYVRDKTIKSLKNRKNIKSNNSREQKDTVAIFYRIHYAGERRETLLKLWSENLNLHSLPPSNNIVEYLEYAKFIIYGNTKIIENC